MNTEMKKDETPKQQTAEGLGSVSAAAQNIRQKSGYVYGQAEQAVTDAYDKTTEKVSDAYDKATEKVSDAYDKTTEKVSETYEKAKSFSNENPGKTILIALGIGIGLGFLLGASSRRSGVTGRLARPVVNALSDIAMEFWH